MPFQKLLKYSVEKHGRATDEAATAICDLMMSLNWGSSLIGLRLCIWVKKETVPMMGANYGGSYY